MKKMFKKYEQSMGENIDNSCAVLTPRYEVETECSTNCSRKQGIQHNCLKGLEFFQFLVGFKHKCIIQFLSIISSDELVRLEFAYMKHHLSTHYQLFFFLEVTFQTRIEFKLQGSKCPVAHGGRNFFMSTTRGAPLCLFWVVCYIFFLVGSNMCTCDCFLQKLDIAVYIYYIYNNLVFFTSFTRVLLLLQTLF